MNGPALPSMIGTSGPAMSMRRLSMPRPHSADIRCSTVDTLASPRFNVDESRVSPISPARAGISTGATRSVRRNTIPLSTGAGASMSSTRAPVCKPTPVVEIALRSVRCFNMGTGERSTPCLPFRRK